MNSKTELLFVIDKSGSMSGLESDTIGGFNSTLNRQKGCKGEVIVSTVLFNGRSATIHDRVDIKQVQPMTQEDYVAEGNTAMLDAIGLSVEHILSVHAGMKKEDVPSKIIAVIITDGYENSSRNFTYESVKSLIDSLSKKGWEFMFLGANIDVAKEAGRMGIRRDNAMSYDCDSEGVENMYCMMSNMVYDKMDPKYLEDEH